MRRKSQWCEAKGLEWEVLGHTCETLPNYIATHKKWGPQSPKSKSRFLILALCGEVGELANLFKKEWRDNKPLKFKEVKKELADCGNYLFILADHLGIDLEEEMLNKMREVSARKVFLKAMRKKGVK